MFEIINIDDEDMLSPNWEPTIRQMHETIFGNGSVSSNEDNDEANRTDAYHEFTQQFSDITGTVGDAQAIQAEEESAANGRKG